MKSEQNPFFKARSFRDVLLLEFEARKERRPRYSSRAFARDLGIKPTTFNGVMRGRYGISAETARAIAKALNFDSQKSQFFLDLVLSRHARTKLERLSAQTRLRRFQPVVDFQPLVDESIQLLSKWYYPAVLELVSIHGKRLDSKKIAEALRISEDEAKVSLENLAKLGIIQKSGSGFVRNRRFLKASGATPSEIIRGWHNQILRLAQFAIERQPVAKRKYVSTIFSFDSRKLSEARDALSKFHEDFMSEFATSRTNDSVYAFGIQLFQVDDGNDT